MHNVFILLRIERWGTFIQGFWVFMNWRIDWLPNITKLELYKNWMGRKFVGNSNAWIILDYWFLNYNSSKKYILKCFLNKYSYVLFSGRENNRKHLFEIFWLPLKKREWYKLILIKRIGLSSNLFMKHETPLLLNLPYIHGYKNILQRRLIPPT